MNNRTIKFHYYTGESTIAKLVRYRLATVFSHVIIEFEDGQFLHSDTPGGVGVPDLEGYPEPSHTSVLEVTEAGYAEALAYAKAQIGGRYDWVALIGFILGNKTQSKSGLFCSEYALNIFKRATGIDVGLHNLLSPGQHRLMVDTYIATVSRAPQKAQAKIKGKLPQSDDDGTKFDRYHR